MIFQNCYTSFGEWNLRQFWNITSGIYAKYQLQIMLLFVYITTLKRFVIFTCRYFKLRWNTTALSQSNCRNFSCSSIKFVIAWSGWYGAPLSLVRFHNVVGVFWVTLAWKRALQAESLVSNRTNVHLTNARRSLMIIFVILVPEKNQVPSMLDHNNYAITPLTPLAEYWITESFQ